MKPNSKEIKKPMLDVVFDTEGRWWVPFLLGFTIASAFWVFGIIAEAKGWWWFG